jgi:hypothetical protein
MICILTIYYSVNNIEKDEVGWACSTYGRQKRFMQGFGWERRERDHLEDVSVGGRKILSGSSRSVMWGMDWNDLAKDKDRWSALINAVMKLRVP